MFRMHIRFLALYSSISIFSSLKIFCIILYNRTNVRFIVAIIVTDILKGIFVGVKTNCCLFNSINPGLVMLIYYIGDDACNLHAFVFIYLIYCDEYFV